MKGGSIIGIGIGVIFSRSSGDTSPEEDINDALLTSDEGFYISTSDEQFYIKINIPN